MYGKKMQASLNISAEVENMGLECEPAFAAICYWAGLCWEGR